MLSEDVPSVVPCFESDLLFPKVIADSLRLNPRNNRRKRGRVRLPNSLHAAEVLEKAASGTRAHARNLHEFGGTVAHLTALAMERHGEAVSFVANELNQVQHRRMMIERDRIFLLP